MDLVKEKEENRMLKRKLSALPADEHNVHKIIITIAVVLYRVL